MILSSFAVLLGFSGYWIPSFTLIKVSDSFFLLILRGIRSLSGDTVVILAPCLDILEILGLSLLTFISFGFSVLVLLSDKMDDEIDLDYLVFYCVFCFSPFRSPWFFQWPWFIQCHTFVWFTDDIFILFTLICLWFVCFVYGVNLIFSLWWVMAFSATLRFVSIALIPSLTIFL